jgi:hypothetical protein
MIQSLPVLPFDCIYNILKELQHIHKGSLFNWLFLNRLWCEQTVPFVWKNPLLISHKCSFKNRVLFIRTLLLFFDQVELSKLKELNIDLKQIIQENQRPLFNYVEYFEEIPFLSSCIRSWLFEYFNLDEKNRSEIPARFFEHKIQPIESLIKHMILRRSKRLKTICPIQNENYNEIFDKEFFDFNLFRLKDTLQTFKMTIYPKISNNILILSQSIIDKNINHLENFIIDFYEKQDFSLSIPLLGNIIKKQNRVLSLELTGQLYNKHLEYIPIFLSLNSHQNNLILLKFYNIKFTDISLNILMKCVTLKELLISDCDGITLENIKLFSNALFKLINLSIFNQSNLSFNITTSIVKFLGNSLKCLLLDQLTNEISKSLSYYASNLSTLFLYDDDLLYDISLIFDFLKSSRLENLHIIHQNYNYSINYNIIKSLSKSLPSTLKLFEFYFYYLSSENFKDLFDSSNIFSLKSLILICYNSTFYTNYNLEAIVNYVKFKNNNLKYLEICSPKFRDWEIDELYLLEILWKIGVEVQIRDL